MRLIVEHQQLPGPFRQHLTKAGEIAAHIIFGFRTEHLGHNTGFTVAVFLPRRPLIKLLDISEKQRAFRRGALGIPAHHTVKFPEDVQLARDQRVQVEDAPTLEVGVVLRKLSPAAK